MLERLQPALEHPVRLLLVGLADLAHDVLRQALVLLVAVDRVLVFPAVLVVLGQILNLCCHFAFTSSPGHAVSPHAAPFSAFNPRSAHLIRAGLIGMPRFAST